MAGPYKIPLEPVTSSNIAALGYDAEKQILAVQFASGEVYHHAEVSPESASALATAESIGRHYGKHIRGKFASEKMTGGCPKCAARGYIGEACSDCGTESITADPKKEKAGESDGLR